MNIDMSTPITKTIGNTVYEGRRWKFNFRKPHIDSSYMTEEEISAANIYNNRNQFKVLECDVYLGIQYAQHPEKGLRWKPPVPYNAPSGRIDCTKFPDVPYQSYIEEGKNNGREEFGKDAGLYNWAKYPGGTKESERIAYYHLFIPVGTPPTGGWPIVDVQHGGGWGVNAANQYNKLAHRFAAIHGCAVRLPEYPLSSFGWGWDKDWESEPDFEGPDFALEFLKMFVVKANQDASAWGLNPSKAIYSGSSAGGAGTLAAMEIPEMGQYYSGFWVASGGGNGLRWFKKPNRSNIGYEAFWNNFKEAVLISAPYIKDYSGNFDTLEELINSIGFGKAIRIGLSPENVMTFADGRRYLTGFNTTLRYAYKSTTNIFPLADSKTLVARSSLDAARKGLLVNKPMVISSCGNEASLYGVTFEGNVPNINPDNFAELLGYIGSAHIRNTPWFKDLDNNEYLRVLCGTAIFDAPAHLIAHEHTRRGGVAYLNRYNYKSKGNGGNYTGHSTDFSLMLRNENWVIGLDSKGKERLYERDLRMGWLMGQSLAAFAYTGTPDGFYTWSSNPLEFSNPPTSRLKKFSLTDYNTNVIGQANHGIVIESPATIVSVNNFRKEEMESYRTKLII